MVNFGGELSKLSLAGAAKTSLQGRNTRQRDTTITLGLTHRKQIACAVLSVEAFP